MSKIIIFDDLEPEATAMLSALYSRSIDSVTKHIDEVRERGSAKFMRSFYVGFSHKSIADTAVTTLYIENVSMLNAKSIQDNPLYSGQESSTRYIDFSKQDIITPVKDDELTEIQETWRKFYIDNMEPLCNHLSTIYPRSPEDDNSKWEKSIKVKAFDILRSVLPAGTATKLSWTTNLRQAHDVLSVTSHHPLEEVRITSSKMLDELKSKYPDSFSHRSALDKEDYFVINSNDIAYHWDRQRLNRYEYSLCKDNNVIMVKTPDKQILHDNYYGMIANRPVRTELPRVTNRAGEFQFIYRLDYGSFRDIQRHRAGYTTMPLLTDTLGFNTWYLKQMPLSMATDLISLLCNQRDKLDNVSKRLGLSEAERQYMIPMGYNVQVESNYTLRQALYVVELRSGIDVHPTLRSVIKDMYSHISTEIPYTALHVDKRNSSWNVNRGDQDIVKLL